MEEDIVILGGGLAGLSAAFHCGGMVFEASSSPGGTCSSPEKQGYVFDLGIHVLHTRDSYVLSLLRRDLGVDLFEQPRRAWIQSYGAKTRYPFQANLFGLPVSLVKECLVAFIETYCRRRYQSDIECSNYEEWIREAFGDGIAERFMIPYSEKFWTVHPRELTTDWLDIRIPMPALSDVIEGALTSNDKGFGPNAVFKYPRRGGIAALPMALARSGVRLRCSCRAVRVDLERKTVEFANGERCRYKVLVSTIPLPELVRISHPSSQAAAQVDGLRHTSIYCVNLGIKHPHVNPEHWIYFPESRYAFFRISFPHNFAPGLTPPGRSSISAEMSYSSHAPLDKGEAAGRVVEDLVDAGIISGWDDIEMVDCRDVPYGYVIYDHKRRNTVDAIKGFFSGYDVLCAGRYGSWEYQWMDDAILDGRGAAAMARRRVETC